MQERELIDKLSVKDRIRLFSGQGSWKTYGQKKGIPYFVMSDGPHGLRKQNEESYADMNKSNVATCFPTGSCIASSWSRESISLLASAIADEALAEKVDVVLGCGINIKRSPLCGRNFEYYSEDPYLTGVLASNYINAMQSKGVGTSLKHFACNNQEKRRQTSNSIVDERTLHEIYLRAFEIAVKKSQPYTIMASYNRVNGEYVTESYKMLQEILRDKWGFNGLVVSDWGACLDPVESLKAGLDLAMPDGHGYFDKKIQKALDDKIIELSLLDNSNKRIINLSNNAIHNKTGNKADYKKNNEIAFNLACDSAVLLRNKRMLPLKKGKVVVIGELAEYMKFQGGGSSHITIAPQPNAIDSLIEEGYEVYYAKGYCSSFVPDSKVKEVNKPLYLQALSLANMAKNENLPVLFFTGLTEKYEGEGFDRENLDLPTEQLELLNAILTQTDNICVVNFSGGPVIFPFRHEVKAILQMYLAGQSVGKAVAALVSGKVNPSGKLVESFPHRIEETPCHDYFAPEGDNVEYREQTFVGYRHYASNNIKTQYEFGFGLSYTTFEYSNFKVQEGFVSLDVTNTGDYDGKEVVEIYVTNPISPEHKKLRALTELKGFEKVFVKKGETKRVTIELDDKCYCVYSPSKGDWVKVGGSYIISAASSLSSIKLSEEVIVEGISLEEAVSEVPEDFYINHRVKQNQKGCFTVRDSLGDLAKQSSSIKRLCNFIAKVLVLTSRQKSAEDPAVRIALSALQENPLISLVSTSGGILKEGFVKHLVKKANRR